MAQKISGKNKLQQDDPSIILCTENKMLKKIAY